MKKSRFTEEQIVRVRGSRWHRAPEGCGCER